MTTIPTILNYEDCGNLIPVILKYLQKYDNNNFEVEIQTFNGINNWVISDPLERYETYFSRFITEQLHKLNNFPGFTLVGEDPLDSLIYSQLNQETVVFNGLLLSKTKLNVGGRKNELINNNFKFIKGKPIITEEMKDIWNMTDINNTSLGIVFVSKFDETVDFQPIYQDYYRFKRF